MAGILKSGTVASASRKKITGKKFAIVVADWNEEITSSLLQGAITTLVQNGVDKKNILQSSVPGSFELPLGALWEATKKQVDAVICLGCVIKGETPHFDYICQAVALGIMEVGLKTGKPVIFGVLTTLNKKQAEERAGGKFGNKGEEAAVTAIQMLLQKA
jgi:6,7-dimethyl-8-ribityllumazine synthase